MSVNKTVMLALESAIKTGDEVTFKYTALDGNVTTRTATPQEFVVGPSGKAVVAVDKADSQTRRFLVGSISGVSA